jgi:hypothetical protein
LLRANSSTISESFEDFMAYRFRRLGSCRSTHERIDRAPIRRSSFCDRLWSSGASPEIASREESRY